MPKTDSNSKPDQSRVLRAFLLAPFAPGITIATFMTVLGPFTGWSLQDTILSAIGLQLFAFLTTLILGYPVALLFGLPAYWLLFKLGFRKWPVYVATCALLGIISWLLADYIIFTAFDHRPIATRNIIEGAEFGAICGAIAGIAFWRIARPDRPAQSQMSTTNSSK